MAILKIRDKNGNVHEIAALRGERGEKGDKGVKGDTGAQGVQGERGEKGDPFKYSDFTEEQLAQLKGEKGDVGAQGVQGVQGEKGDTGDKGDRGEDGKDGVVDYSLTANALKGTVTGNPVAIKDASPLEHEVSVKVDVGGATVTKYGKNLLKLEGASSVNCIINTDGTVQSNIENNYYGTISRYDLAELLLKNRGKHFTFSVADNKGKAIGVHLYKGTTSVKSYPEATTRSTTIQIPEDIDFERIVFRFNIGTKREDKTTVFSDFQFEFGDTATEYVPYIEPITKTTDGNGEVNGITADGNGATLFADSGATITAEYNKDANKVIAALMERIGSLEAALVNNV